MRKALTITYVRASQTVQRTHVPARPLETTHPSHRDSSTQSRRPVNLGGRDFPPRLSRAVLNHRPAHCAGSAFRSTTRDRRRRRASAALHSTPNSLPVRQQVKGGSCLQCHVADTLTRRIKLLVLMRITATPPSSTGSRFEYYYSGRQKFMNSPYYSILSTLP